ncbi:MAG TPA: beta/gamma crystallin-related protein [Spirochaetota bacterium]|nr:beta/gamma crystallin-related protein [Spirochaetota bacterium]HPI91146.1 beta/gamma crystallin-related protein [Spirochaetota bacterium]HPR47897.1 beta/gamma crystallin-related protein [Spirochaetota bacterium]
MKKNLALFISLSLLIITAAAIKTAASNYKKIPLVLELYEKENFGGRKIVIAVDTPDLDSYCFNDKANSLKVYAGPSYEGGMKVKVYSGKDYKGGYIELSAQEEVKNLGDEKEFGNTISSIKFPY